MTPRLLVSIFFVALCAGCAATGSSTDWYSLGANEGRLGAGPQEAYLESRFSSPADRQLYLRGWEAGFAQRPVQSW
jgi:hypothetical protein